MESYTNTSEDCIASSQTKADECVHHWDIATAEGPVSQGQCQKCDAVREFSNSFGYIPKYYARFIVDPPTNRYATVKYPKLYTNDP